MKKYFLVAKNTWEEMLTYRLNFFMWRVRVILQILTLYFLWLAVLPKGGSLLGYSQPQLLTYILGTALLNSIVLSSRSYAVGDDINQGTLSHFLLLPMNYFLYWFAKDLGDKAMNILFAVFELIILFIILRPPFFIQTNFLLIGLFAIASFIALGLYFLLNLLLGFMGFWSPETWAPRFIFITLISFFAGGLFPLDILPKSVFIILSALPFNYLLYFPLKIYLGQLSMLQIIIGIFVSVFWLATLYKLLSLVWTRGLMRYTAQGI